MYPVIFKLGSFTLRTYGVIVLFALLVAWWLARKEAKEKDYQLQQIDSFIFLAVTVGVGGARLYYVLFNLSYYLQNPYQISMIWDGGLAIHGGLIGGVLAGIWFCWRNKLRFWRLADTLTPAIILGQAVGRVACFFNGDAYGKPTNLPWGVTFTHPLSSAPKHISLHPTQLYQLAWNLLVFGVVWSFHRRVKYEGELFLMYAILYSLGRFFIENLRGDQLIFSFFGLAISTARTMSVVTILSVVIFHFILRKQDRMGKVRIRLNRGIKS
ncbi:MAG: prolipoprotein diacylglyceryl transferase [bacterium]